MTRSRFVVLFLVVTVFFCAPISLAQPTPSSSVRILIVENQKTVSLTLKGAYVIRLLPSLQVVKRGDLLKGAPVVVTPQGLKVGQEEWRARGIRIEQMAERDLFLNKSRFRGSVDIWKNSTGLLYAINALGLEEYLYGVLPHEVAPWWPMEALKAQAIAARTYALYQVQVSKKAEFDLKSNTSSQVYGGSTTERYRTKRAVDLTAGKVLTYQGKLFPAYFHATCAGLTAGAAELWKIDIPPLQGKARCSYCRVSPHTSWEARVPLADIEEKMKQNGRYAGQIIDLKIISQTPSGRVGSLSITGTNGEMVIAAKDFRIWVGGNRIRSTRFTVRVTDDSAEFQGKGWGHGVGLCQWGALGQALLGHSAEKILHFYYPGAEVGVRS